MTPSVIPFQKAHDLYINADFRKNEKFDILINKIFRFVKKIGKKVPYFAARVPKLCGRYSQLYCIFRKLLIGTLSLTSDI